MESKQYNLYIITNLLSGKYYVGQTTMTVKERWSWHLIEVKHGSYYIHRAIRKYGVENFKVETIGTCTNQEELDLAEDFLIVHLGAMNPVFGYNQRRGGAGGRPNEATKKKIGESNKANWANPSVAMLAAVAKLIKETKVRQKLPMPETHRLAIGLSHLGKPKPKTVAHRKKLSDHWLLRLANEPEEVWREREDKRIRGYNAWRLRQAVEKAARLAPIFIQPRPVNGTGRLAA